MYKHAALTESRTGTGLVARCAAINCGFERSSSPGCEYSYKYVTHKLETFINTATQLYSAQYTRHQHLLISWELAWLLILIQPKSTWTTGVNMRFLCMDCVKQNCVWSSVMYCDMMYKWSGKYEISLAIKWYINNINGRRGHARCSQHQQSDNF